jgi:peptidyl-prolyl cis-trans isomerase A (cyclophilin A)
MRFLPARLLVSLLGLGCAAGPVLASDYVCLETNFGDICMELLPDVAPVTVANFLDYVEAGEYDNTLVHYSYPGGLFQGGGYYGDPFNFGVPIRTKPPIVLESSLRSNLRGTVAMARNTGFPDSASSQWFINIGDNSDLDDTWDGGYTVFAEIVLGLEVADLIGNLPIGDFSALLGFPFQATPVNIEPTDDFADLEDFVLIERAYHTQQYPGMLPYQCSVTSPGDTLTEFCGSSLRFPVQIDGLLFEATLVFVPSTEGLIFSVQRESLQLLTDTGQERAHYAAGELLIPSVRTPAGAFVNVSLLLQDLPSLKFALNTFSPR